MVYLAAAAVGRRRESIGSCDTIERARGVIAAEPANTCEAPAGTGTGTRYSYRY